jgi:hypothetical protein
MSSMLTAVPDQTETLRDGLTRELSTIEGSVDPEHLQEPLRLAQSSTNAGLSSLKLWK